MTLRELQCPHCGSAFRTSNRTKRFCTPKCQERHKATMRATARDFKPDYQQQHRCNSGANSSRRAAQGPPVVDWPTVIDRFKKWSAEAYGGDEC